VRLSADDKFIAEAVYERIALFLYDVGVEAFLTAAARESTDLDSDNFIHDAEAAAFRPNPSYLLNLFDLSRPIGRAVPAQFAFEVDEIRFGSTVIKSKIGTLLVATNLVVSPAAGTLPAASQLPAWISAVGAVAAAGATVFTGGYVVWHHWDLNQKEARVKERVTFYQTGSKIERNKKIQNDLALLGYYQAKPRIDGVFGARSRDALDRFLRRHQLHPALQHDDPQFLRALAEDIIYPMALRPPRAGPDFSSGPWP
jgi:hypothetical protein